jgi:hypothetical protein
MTSFRAITAMATFSESQDTTVNWERMREVRERETTTTII